MEYLHELRKPDSYVSQIRTQPFLGLVFIFLIKEKRLR